MINTIIYGLTIGAVLYFISIGLSLTFGTMKIVNFAHALVYTLGIYMVITFLPLLKGNFWVAALIGTAVVVPVSYVIERFIIRRLYGESLDYAIIATYAVLLIGVDVIKWIWGVNPYPMSDPIGKYLSLGGLTIPVYRILIVVIAVLLFGALNFFFRKSIVGKLVVAAL
jgi:branched-chain amino acid transport system permease protein